VQRVKIRYRAKKADRERPSRYTEREKDLVQRVKIRYKAKKS
jgi:hypothetical protein